MKARGDAALLEYTNRFDEVGAASAGDLAISLEECAGALERLPTAQRAALEAAAQRVRSYHEHQRAESWSFRDSLGNELGQRVTPLDRVGVYVPGGKAAYPSSVIMNVMPAKVAGVAEIVMAVPTPQGERNPLVLAAAALCGVDRVFAIGGAQAVGAMAYGTESVPAVDKIVGPGNAYVAAAKRRVFGVVGIDMVAGPSEILVVADGESNPDWIAMDLFSQASTTSRAVDRFAGCGFPRCRRREHDEPDAQMPRRQVIREALDGRARVIHARDLEKRARSSIASPEHLELSVDDPEPLLAKIRHAGAIFVGRYASEAIGDYCAGPNHVLPTSRTARLFLPLGVYDFQKRRERDSHHPRGRGEARRDRVGARTRRRPHRARPLRRIPHEITRRTPRRHHSRRGAGRSRAITSPSELHGEARRDGKSYRMPEGVCARSRHRLARGDQPYPDAAAGRLKARLRTTLGIPQDKELILGNGSDEIIQMLMLATARPGATVLSVAPTFVMFGLIATYCGMQYVSVPLTRDFALDAEATIAAVEAHRPALVFLAYPNNPTGNLFDEAIVDRILRVAPGLVVVDEAYHAFADHLHKRRAIPEPLVMAPCHNRGLRLRSGSVAAGPNGCSTSTKCACL